MTEYGGYTVERIENELTYEQLFLFIETILDRRQRQRDESPSAGGGYSGGNKVIERHMDIEDLAEGRVPADLGIAVVKKVVS